MEARQGHVHGPGAVRLIERLRVFQEARRDSFALLPQVRRARWLLRSGLHEFVLSKDSILACCVR
jgi:hypothetical protein